MAEVDAIIQYSEWTCWKKLVAGCEPWLIVFADEYSEECDDCEWNSFFDLDDIPECPIGAWPFFLTINSGCTELSYYSLEDLIDQLAGTDIKVKVDDADADSWFLFDKIKACVSNDYIDVVLDNSWANHFLRICLDAESLFADMSVEDIGDWPEPGECADEQSAIDMWDGSECPVCEDEWCVTQYLAYCGGNYFWECNPCWQPIVRKARAMYAMVNTVNFTQANGLEKFYYLSQDNITQLNNAWWDRLATAAYGKFARHCIDTDNAYIKIKLPWDYMIGYNGSIEITKWVHAFRFWMVIVRWSLILPFTQDRWSGVGWEQYAWYTAADGHPFLGIYGNNDQTIANQSPGGSQFSLARVIERFTVGQSMWTHLLKDDIIVPFVRISTIMTGDDEAAVAAPISIIGASEISTGFPQAFFYQVFNLDDDCDRKYWNKKNDITSCPL